MIYRGTWSQHISRQILREHGLWLRDQGGTRLVLEGCRLDDLPARGTQIARARFMRCSLRQANLTYSILSGLELEDCVLDGAGFVSSDLDRSRLDGCAFVRADLRITRLKMAEIANCDFSGALLDRADFTAAVLKGSSFRGALFYDATLDNATLESCDLRGADMRFVKMDNLCTTTNTWFWRCDLRGVNIAGRQLQDTRFTECRFHGMVGRPLLAGTCTIERPNMASADDEEELCAPEEVLRMWEAAG